MPPVVWPPKSCLTVHSIHILQRIPTPAILARIRPNRLTIPPSPRVIPPMPQLGKLVVISGPSGTGKSSICRGLLEQIPNAVWSVSVTTRPIRPGEVDGREYRFISRSQFDRMVAANELLEHAEYLMNGYGTPRKPVEDALAAGRSVIMEIDVQGGAQVAARMPESVRIFILPPTMETLKARLAGRKTESEELQAKRLREAEGEIAFARDSGHYPFFITNDTIEDSVARILEIVKQEQHKA